MNTSTKYLSLMAVFAGVVGSTAAHAEDFKPDFKFNSLVQAWLYNDTNAAAKPDFRIRRAELRFSGNVTQDVRWFTMIDMAKNLSNSNASGDNKFLQDIGAGYTLMTGTELVVGQFKTLTSAEGLGKASELLMPERSVSGRFYGDKREQGAMVSYKFEKFQFGAMIGNDNPGSTQQNQQDNNGKKDLTARVDYDVMDGVKIGAFTGAGNYSYSNNGRTGANVSAALGDLVVGAEGALGNVLNGAQQQKNSGIMGYAGYTLMGKWQPVVRFSNLNPFTNNSDYGLADTQSAQEYSVGLNYYIAKNNAKIQAAYTYLKNDIGQAGAAAANTSTILSSAGAKSSIAQVSFQVAL